MTKRNANSIFVMMSLSIGLALGALSTAEAQPILERLEERIRSRIEARQPSEPEQPPEAIESGRTAEPPLERTVRPAEASTKRGYLGLIADDRDEQGRGVRVLDTRPDGPAAKGGFQKDDLITSVAGIRVHSLAEMADILNLLPPGKQVAFDIIRDQKTQRLTVTLGVRPEKPTAPGDPSSLPPLVPPSAPPEATPAPGSPPLDDAPGEVVSTAALLARIEALERRVAELERALAAGTTEP